MTATAAVTAGYTLAAGPVRADIIKIDTNGLNAGLVILFIGGFHLGVAGAAVATVVAQSISVVLCLVFVRRRMTVLALRREDWRIRRAEVDDSSRLGLTMGFQMSVIATA